MPLDQVATFQKLLKPVLPTIKPLLPFRRGGPGPKSKFLRGCSDVQFLWTLIAWAVLRYIHRLPKYAFLDVSIRKEVIRGDDSMARKLWESYETTAGDGVKDRLEGVTDEIEDYLPEGSCARTIPVSKKEVPAVLNATLARIEHAISIAKLLARTNIPAMKHRNMAKIIPKWTLEGVYAAVQNMHRGRPLQEHGHLPNAQKVNVALAAHYKNAAIRAPEIPKEIVSMNAINADPYLYRGMHGEMAAGAVEKGGLVEAKGYIAFSSNKHMAMTFAHEKTNNNNSNNNNNGGGNINSNNNRGTSNNNNNVMSMRSSNNNRGTSSNNNNAMSVRSSNNNRGTSSNNNNAMNNKRPHTVYGSNSNSENEVGSNAWRAKHDVMGSNAWNSNSNVNTSNNNNNVPNKKKNGGFIIRRDGHAIRMQFIMFKLALRDVPRGTPWLWFANDENINIRKAKHAIKSTTAENEVLLPPGKVTFKNQMDRRMSTAIAATMKTPASSSGAFYDASSKKWTAKKTARSVLQTMRTEPKSTTIKILGGFDADVEHIVRASCMHIRYFLKTAQYGAGDTPAVRLASPNIMGIRMLRMIQMACIHHKLGIFDVPDDDSWEPLTFDAIYVPDPSATNATLRRIVMAGPRKTTAPSKGVDGYEPLYKMFSTNNSRKRTKNGIQKTVSQLTRAVAVVNRQIKASPRRLRPRR